MPRYSYVKWRPFGFVSGPERGLGITINGVWDVDKWLKTEEFALLGLLRKVPLDGEENNGHLLSLPPSAFPPSASSLLLSPL